MAKEKSRFQFPGFTLTASRDTSTHEVEVGTITDGGVVFVVELIRNARFPNLDFLLAKVTDVKSEVLWTFKSENFDGAGVLAKAGDVTVIAIMGRGKNGKVERVTPFGRLTTHQPINLRKQIELKMLAAEFLGRKFNLTATESAIAGVDAQREFEARKAVKEAEREARQVERRDRILGIKKRTRLEAYAADGSVRHGYPVVETEWPSMPNGTFVILVDSIDENGKPGKAIECFRVVKERGQNALKANSVLVTSERPAMTPAAAAPKPVGRAVIEKDGNAFEVILFAKHEDIRKAKAAGLNGGTLVAVRPEVNGGKIEVYEVHAKNSKTWGKFASIPVA